MMEAQWIDVNSMEILREMQVAEISSDSPTMKYWSFHLMKYFFLEN